MSRIKTKKEIKVLLEQNVVEKVKNFNNDYEEQLKKQAKD